MGPDNLLEPSTFDAMFSLALVVVAVGFVVTIALAVRNASLLHKRGIDPTTVEAELAARLLESQALAPPRPQTPSDPPVAEPARSLADRLAELDTLLANGTITADEHAAARARVLDDA